MAWFQCQVRYGVKGPGRWDGKVVIHATTLVHEMWQIRGISVSAVQKTVQKMLTQSKKILRRSIRFLNTHEIPTPSWAREA